MNDYSTLVRPILEQYPKTKAIYLFGSYGTEDEWPASDIDIGILLPVDEAKKTDPWKWIELSNVVATASKKEKADLVNLRQADTVFRKEIIYANRRIYCADETAADEFEMLTLSLYQQLQEERKDIIEDAIRSGRFRHA